MISDAGQRIGEPGLRINAVEFGGFERERKKLCELLVWVTEKMAAEVLTRARKSASHGIRLKRAVQNEVIGLTLRHSDEFGYV